MGWPKRLVLVRHAESEGNIRTGVERAGYDIGSQAYALTKRGRLQAKLTGDYLRERFGTFDVRYVSYYERSKETMSLLYPDEKVYEDPRLAEAQRGIWHTMTPDEVAVKYPGELVRRTREGLYHYRPLGGENWPDVELRIHSFLGTMNRDYEVQDVVIVGHGHWLILFERLVLRKSIDEAVDQYKSGNFENASVTIYEAGEINGKERLVLKEKNIVPWADKIPTTA